MQKREWVPIKGFSRYWINANGDVLDSDRSDLVNPHQVTGGALSVRLKNDEGYFCTRSVKVLVAEEFVDLDFDATDIDLSNFDTPILLDNNPLNVAASNIRIRPRWFAWQYTHQFNALELRFGRGPLYDFTTKEVYDTVIIVGMTKGLLFKTIYDAAETYEDHIYFTDQLRRSNTPPPLWPTRDMFAWV